MKRRAAERALRGAELHHEDDVSSSQLAELRATEAKLAEQRQGLEATVAKVQNTGYRIKNTNIEYRIKNKNIENRIQSKNIEYRLQTYRL